MSRLLLILFLNTLTGLYATAQVNKSKIYQMPENYTHPYGPYERNLNTSTCVGGNPKNEEWVVYSDRDNNQLYKDPQLSIKGKVAGFMDAFYVIEDICDKGIVRIIKFDKSIRKNKSYDIDPKAAVDMGYISKKNLLLWKNSLIDDSTHFTIKGLPAHRIERFIEMKSAAKFKKSESELKLFNAPDHATANDNVIRMFEFLYIFKKEGNSMLLGRSDQFSPQSVTEILGWAPRFYIEEWNQRICMEPNTNAEAVAERNAKKIKASFFHDTKSAQAFDKSPGSVEPLFVRDKGSETFSPYIKRFPVIKSYFGGNVVQTRASTDIYGQSGREPVMGVEDQARYMDSINKVMEKAKKFNIVFVVEASTRISREYLKQIITGLEDMGNQLPESEEINANSGYQYNFGAVVYRSYEHGNCSGTTDLVASSMDKLVPKDEYSRVQDFLGTQIVKATDCDNQATGNALYKGLDKALGLFRDTLESNVLVLIGTKGDQIKEKVISRQSIIDHMAQYKASFIAYQYDNASGPEYDMFVSQIKFFLRQSARKITRMIDPKADANFLDLGEEANVFELDPATSAVPGKALLSSNTGRMPSEKLREELIATVLDLQAGVEKKIEQAIRFVGGIGSSKDTAMSYNVKLLFINAGIDINDKEVMKDLSSDNFQMFVPAYAVLKPQGFKNNLFRHVILINDLEFGRLMSTLNRLVTAGNNASEQRIALYDTYLDVLKDHFGEKESKKKIREMEKRGELTAGKVLELLTGLPAQSDLPKKVKITDIPDEDKISDTDLASIINGITEKYNSLKKIRNDPNNKYSFISSADKYYWVPQEDLP